MNNLVVEIYGTEVILDLGCMMCDEVDTMAPCADDDENVDFIFIIIVIKILYGFIERGF